MIVLLSEIQIWRCRKIRSSHVDVMTGFTAPTDKIKVAESVLG